MNTVKVIIFDADGMIVHGKRFSTRLAEEYAISTDTTGEFFKGEFQNCLVGKSDLKKELLKHINSWGWKGTVQDLLEYWFSENESVIENRFEIVIKELREKGIRCCLATNNEKYRTKNLTENRGIGKWFDHIFSSGYIGSKKPETEFFSHIMNNFPDTKKDEIIFWDDDVQNIEGARAFGLKTEIYTDFDSFKKKISFL